MTFNILHFSDLHFGLFSIENDFKKAFSKEDDFKKVFSRFYAELHKYIKSLIEKKKPCLVIISGDIGSAGSIEKSEHLIKFFKIFTEKKIPILTCIGNHSNNWGRIGYNDQFLPYINFIRNSEKNFGCVLSEKFEENQASYIYLKDINSFFISINSSKYIEAIDIGVGYNGKLLYDNVKLNRGYFSIEQLEDVLEEIREKDVDGFENAHKFLVCHHPPANLNIPQFFSEILDDFNIKLIFSGHFHESSYLDNGYIQNFITGSILSKESQRTHEPIMTVPIQFNRYEFDLLENKIKMFISEKTEQCPWKEEHKISVSIHPQDNYSFVMKPWITKGKYFRGLSEG